MNKALQIAKKLQLWSAIKQLGEKYKEDAVFTQQFAKDIYTENINDIDVAINCFSDLLKQKVKL